MRGCLIRCLSVGNCLDNVNKRGKTKPTVDITIPQTGGVMILPAGPEQLVVGPGAWS